MEFYEQLIGIFMLFFEGFKANWDIALVVFLAVGLMKAMGAIKKDGQAQLGNIFLSFIVGLADGSTLISDPVGTSMIVVVAGAYYHIWKLVKPYLAKAYNFIKNKLQKK